VSAMRPMPTLFVGHGSPMNAIEDNDFSRAWRALGTRLPRPRAILCVSAHWETAGVAVTADARPATIHDFYGFPEALYAVDYPAPGDAALARRVAALLAPLPVRLADDWGLDHGAWSVLRLIYPDADVPVVQLGIDTTLPAAHHGALARHLAPLRDEGVLVMGSGNIVHNLYEVDWSQDAAPDLRTVDYDAWVRDAVAEGRHDELIDYRRANPISGWAAPTAEHYLPLLYVLGLQGDDERIETVHESFQNATVSMRSFMTA